MASPLKDNSDASDFESRHSLLRDLLRNLAEYRHWRPRFTRERVSQSIKNLALVGPLTILIWVYAEREQTSKPTINNVQVQFESTNKERYVEYAGTGLPQVS